MDNETITKRLIKHNRILETHTPKLRKKLVFPYISACASGPRAIESGIKAFQRLNNRPPRTFLDIGSGKGGMLISALMFGLEPTGIEYSRELVTKSKEMYQGFPELKTKKIKTIVTDFFKWSPKKEYDMVYFFRPVISDNLWTKFLQHVIDIFPKDQLIVSFYAMPIKGFHKVEHAVYLNSKAEPLKV